MTNKNERGYRIGLFVIATAFAAVLVFRIGSFPNVFLDEGDGMYDSWAMAKFGGVDSNLIKYPVYLEGFSGQGQSVLYAYLAGLFMKVFGYSLTVFRLPLVIISIATLLVLISVALKVTTPKTAFWAALVMATSPWLIVVSRYGMDCNIAPFMAMLGSTIIYYGVKQDQSKRKIGWLTLGFLVLGLVTYSYNVGWIFLPVYLLSLLLFLVLGRKEKLRNLIIPVVALFIEVLPILIFAVRSNIPALNKTVRILFWTSPKLQVGRVNTSFISFNGNIGENILRNLYAGAKMFILGTDKLPWNSVANFGPYYLFTFPFVIWGLIIVFKRRSLVDQFVISQLIGMVLIVLLVTPNYNHWIFLHFANLTLIVIAIVDVTNRYREFQLALLLTYVISASAFVGAYFYYPRYTGWDVSAMETIKELKPLRYKHVYFTSSDPNFLYGVRTAVPVSPYEFQKTKDNPYSKTKLLTLNNYANFTRLENNTTVTKDSLLIMQDDTVANYGKQVKGCKKIGSFAVSLPYSVIKYEVYKK